MKQNYIGCSGFIYPEWKGKFYPSDLAKSKWLRYYSSKFNTVELNGTFYRFPVVKNLKVFHENTPDDFKFSIKANRIITHSLKMKNAKEKVNEFVQIAKDGLMDKLGCILFQLPPSFKYSEENLESILSSVPSDHSSVIEFRNSSWWNKDVYDQLDKNKLTFCNNDFPGMPEGVIQTNKIFYMRFHGRPILYRSEYSISHLKKIVKDMPGDANKYIYFNNTADLAAITNAISIREMLDK
jgi:uncharacterized protein YecE (DUF72 family)